MTKNTTVNFSFETQIKISKSLLRDTLARVRDELLNHRINGGDRRLNMECVVDNPGHGCGTAACIGGWTSLFILGFTGEKASERVAASDLFDTLLALDRQDNSRDRLNDLFYNYELNHDYNEPNVAATAIQRYLDGKAPWPRGKMPDVLPYKRVRRPAAKKAIRRAPKQK